jgi:hypothetical protein
MRGLKPWQLGAIIGVVMFALQYAGVIGSQSFEGYTTARLLGFAAGTIALFALVGWAIGWLLGRLGGRG